MAVKPGDFLLGSGESRAAARAMLEQAKRKPKPMVRIFENGVLKTEREHNGEDDFTVNIEHIAEWPPEDIVNEPPQEQPTEPTPALPSSATDTSSESCAIVPLRRPRPMGSIVRYLQGFR
jgi:hypothetical protein